MRVFKRPESAFYYYQFDINGERYKGSTRRKTKADAERVLAAEYARVMDHRQFGEKPEITLAEAFDRSIRMVDGKTKTSYELVKRKTLGLDKFQGTCWCLSGDMKLNHLTQAHIEDLTQARIDEGLRPNSVNVELRVLQRVYNGCSKRFMTNPDLSFDKLPGFVRRRHVSKDEETKIIAYLTERSHLPSYRKALDLFLFLIDTGSRLSEVLECQWADLNMTEETMEVFRSKTETVSIIPLSRRLILNLKRRGNDPAPFMEHSRAVKTLRKTIDQFCNEDPRTIRQRGKATIHSLRDTYVTRMESKGLSLRQIGKIVGHNSIETTKKYAHLESKALVDQARAALNDD